MALIQALVSVVRDTGDSLQTVRCAPRLSFCVVSTLILRRQICAVEACMGRV